MRTNMDWTCVADLLNEWAIAGIGQDVWKAGQENSLAWIARHIAGKPGLILADEVGLGKTRVAAAVASAVIASGGRVAVLIPPGLKNQWEGEFTRFYRAMQGCGKTMPDVQGRFLRTFDDLFDAQHPNDFIWWQQPSLVYVSHGFGIPQRLTDSDQRRSKPDRWLLPLKVRSRLHTDQRRVKGLIPIDLDETHPQSRAACWLATELQRRDERFAQKLMDADVIKVSHGPRVFLQKDEARQIFHRLIGELIGPVDLIIVDEAHKSREGAQNVDADSCKSRLSSCLNEILAPVARKHAKRIAVTATPLEMDVSQWQDVFARIGMRADDMKRLGAAATHYAETLRATVWFDGMCTRAIERAAGDFQREFEGWVTRRRWCDHEAIRAYREHAGGKASSSHPHRCPMKPLAWAMSSSEKRSILAAEALAQAARGRDASTVAKTYGSRYAQGLTAVDDSSPQQESMPVPQTSARGANGWPAEAHQQRHAYWSRMLANSVDVELASSLKEEFRLQCHPRVRYAIEVIERAAGIDDSAPFSQLSKVLVFGAYNAPLGALNRALNIRSFLHDLRRGVPTLQPTAVKLDDIDFRYWARRDGVDLNDDTTIRRINSQRKAYENQRDGQRQRYNELVDRWIDMRLSSTVAAPVRAISDELVDWLSAHAHAHKTDETIEGELDRLFDNDPDDDTQDDSNDRRSSEVNLAAIRAAIEEDIPDRTSPRSSFARFMYGDMKTLTRGTLQYRFNQKGANPQILLAQTAVASEGLNLHEACRKIVLFHLDWNPARIEQQIGRIDRQDSFWMQSFDAWRRNGCNGPAPVIEVHTVALSGTYDDRRRDVVTERQRTLRSQVFGQLVPEDALHALSDELCEKLARIAPNFSPLKVQLDATKDKLRRGGKEAA